VLKFSNILLLLNPFDILDKKYIYFYDRNFVSYYNMIQLFETETISLPKINDVKSNSVFENT